MRVVVPYTTIHPDAQRQLDRWIPKHEEIYVGHSTTAYYELLAGLWARRESFAVVEHDVEIHRRVHLEFRECPEPWCTFPYPGGGWSHGGDPLLRRSLGCVRFRAELLEAHPDVMGAVGAISDGLPQRDWRRLDVLLSNQLDQRGVTVHVHEPPVEHHHMYLEGCSCGGVH